jgi:predicted NACHT family NTPase
MALLELSVIIDAIVGMGVGAALGKVRRREAVLKLLKRFKLDPGDPPTDFDGIYAYTLIEYGVSKPKPILIFFRNESVRQAFRRSFSQNDPTILDKEAEDIIHWNEETGKLGPIDYDPRREFAAFSAIFSEIVDRTRTPVQVKRDWKLDEIHGDLHEWAGEIVERLGKLDALDDIRELVRLAQSDWTRRADSRELLPQGTPIDYLAQQARTWFKTLGYRFESHDIQAEDCFEWIINVPARRGYDRIFVLGVEGEAKVAHVDVLRRAVDEHKTDEGWLVVALRKSPAACAKVEEEENRDLFCYTFDALLDEHADFSGYFDWLEAEVKHRGIDWMYVPLACTQEEFDPVTKNKIGEGRYDASNGWIDGYVDRWLDDPSKEHISILGEFGTGKTWFALHYAWTTLQRYRQAKERGTKRPRLPLVIPLRDYAKAVSVESLFSEFFFRKYEIPVPGYSAFEQLNRMGKLLLIFDGFDEMAARVDRQEMINNFWELARVVVPGAKVILTCRTEHFPEAKEGRALLSAELQASTAKLTGESPQFEVLELEKFDDDQIRQVLSFRAKKPDTVERVMDNPQLLDLARRPVMTELIIDALHDVESGKPVDLSRVYLYAVRRKMERDIKSERTFTSLADKLYFLCELSWEMFSTDRMSLNYRQFPDHIRRLFGPAVQEQKDLDHWHHDMMAQTMLIRNAHGDYTPAHRSLLEFFAAYKFAAELGVLASDFTEVARRQSHVDNEASSEDYTWSEYFRREIDEHNQVKLIPPLRTFVTDDSSQINKRKYDRLSRNVPVFAAGMALNDLACLDKLCRIALERTGDLAWNAISLLPFLKYSHPKTLANTLVDRGEGGPLRSGIAWVLGELGVTDERVIEALKRTAECFAQGSGASAAAWWESAFALEKLGELGPRKGRQGDEAIRYLIDHLPPGCTYRGAISNLRHALRATTRRKASVNQSDIVVIVKHESGIDLSGLFHQTLKTIDFSTDLLGRRCYYAVWLCGHLGIEESLPHIIEACEHPRGSIRNCASEALGKIGVNSLRVVRALEERLTDGYYRARLHAAWSLGELGSTASIPKLSAAIKVEEVMDVREEMTRVRDFLEKLTSDTV